MNFRYKLARFMSGRYGVDTLFYLLFGIAAVLAVLNCFLRLWFVQVMVYAFILYAFFRAFSRNIPARSRENRFFAEKSAQINRAMANYRARKADTTHVYKKCPNCHAVLRLPRRKGKHTTVCPKCSHSFKVRVFK